MDREFITARTAGWEDVETKTRILSWESLERSAEQTREEMYRFAEAFGKAHSAIIGESRSPQSDRPKAAKRPSGRNVVQIELQPGISLDLEGAQRNFFAASSCGICGKASIDSVRLRGILHERLLV